MRKMMMRAILCLLLFATSGALTGCIRIGFLGDSVTSVAEPTLQAEASKAYYISAFVAAGGIGTAQLLAMARATLPSDVDAVVINIGTNDVGSDNTDWQTSYDALLALVADRPCVVLTTVNNFAEYIDPPIVVHPADINTYIRTQVLAHPNFRLVDWDAAVLSPVPFTTDGLHPSAAGAAWLADADIDAIRSCGAATSASATSLPVTG